MYIRHNINEIKKNEKDNRIKMKNQIKKVIEFNEAFGTYIPDKVTLNYDNLDRLKLQVDLLQEELDETREALLEWDLEELLDGLVDLQVVLYGLVGMFGAKDVFKVAFNRVHRSNMSKFCNTEEEAQQTKKKYEEEGVKCVIEKTGDRYSVIREDGKLLKSVKWRQAKLSDLV